MKKVIATISGLSLVLFALAGQAAEPSRDCMLEGTVYKSGQTGQESTSVKFHSVGKYEKGSSCRMRRGEKLDFKLPEDSRLDEAADGTAVKYRYQQNKDGSSKTELVSIGA